jgi:hypothetical protein
LGRTALTQNVVLCCIILYINVKEINLRGKYKSKDESMLLLSKTLHFVGFVGKQPRLFCYPAAPFLAWTHSVFFIRLTECKQHYDHLQETINKYIIMQGSDLHPCAPGAAE